MLRFLTLVLVTFLIIFIIGFSPIFKVKSITISQGQRCLQSEEIKKELGLVGKNIILVQNKKIIQTIKEKHACLKNLKIKKVLPSTLHLEVEVSQPVVRLENSSLILTEEGIVLEGGDTLSLPTLYTGKDLQLGPDQKVTDSGVIFALSVALNLSKSDFSLSNLRMIDGGSLAAYNQQDLVAIFSSNKDVDRQVDSLQLVLSKAKIDGTKIAKIDLRFDKPVIVYK